MKNKILILGITALILGMLLVTAMPGNSAKNTIKPQIFEKKLSISDNRYVPDEIIVKFKSGVKDGVISNINSKHGAFVRYSSPYGKFKRIGIPKGKTVSEMIEVYRKNPNVEYAEPNYIAYALMVPNDEYYHYQWHLDNAEYGGINMVEAWDISTGDHSVVVAIVDTGIAYENYKDGRKQYCQAPDLANTCFVQGKDFVNNDDHPNDDNSHGTHIAGTIAQSTNNGIGVAGVAFSACLMPVKVLNSRGSGTYTDVADGIVWAADNGAQVISLSLGGSAASETLENALAYAYGKGVTIVAAAGNDGSSTISYPAAYDDYVIAVGATQYDENLAPYSNYGSSLDLVAPGGNNDLDQNGDGYADGVLQQTFKNSWRVCDFSYWFFQGTSMATPHVSGVAALLIANGNTITPDEVRAALQETAEDLGADGRDDIYGYGLVDAYAALQWTAGPVDNPPSVSITSPTDGATVSGLVTIKATATDDVGVVQVDFYVGETLIETDATFPYSVDWDSTSVADGTHQITAKAIDTVYQSASDSISVLVDNANDPPVITSTPVTTATVGELYTYDVESTDPNVGDTLTYSLATAPEGMTIDSTTGLIKWTPTSAQVGANTVEVKVVDTSEASDSQAFTVTVKELPVLTTIEVSPSSVTLNVGDTQQFTASGKDQYGDPIGTGSITWESINIEVGTIDLNGLFTALAAGSTTISATSGDVVGTASVTVKEVTKVLCWSGSNEYLYRNKNQMKKFCKCAQGDYAYQRYRTSRGTKTAYWYTDSGDNTYWDTTFGSVSRPVYKVKCSDSNWYNTTQDYYYGS